MHHDELRELAASYALDALSEEDRRIFEQHVDVCPECAAEVTSLRATVVRAGVRGSPTSGARASARARAPGHRSAYPRAFQLRSRADAADRVRPGSNPWWLAAAATLAAILVGGYALTLRAHINFLDQELREARAQSASAQLQLRDCPGTARNRAAGSAARQSDDDDPRVSGRHPRGSERAGRPLRAPSAGHSGVDRAESSSPPTPCRRCRRRRSTSSGFSR